MVDNKSSASGDSYPPSVGMTADALSDSLLRHLTYSLGKTPVTAIPRDWYHALVLTVRDRLVERLLKTFHGYYKRKEKRVYYLSLEFLMGRSLTNSVLALGIEKETREALSRQGMEYNEIYRCEMDAALGNGGLGRLAACLLDSLASLGLSGYGYGIRYEYGMFNQRFKDGHQVEHPENWLRYGNPWEFARTEVLYPVRFGGRVEADVDEAGRPLSRWQGAEQVMAMAYDMPVPGFRNGCVNNLRLWSAKSSRDFQLQYFQAGDYVRAVQDQIESENLSRVLYPNDATAMGRELRLRQEYFFVSASLQDILRRHLSIDDDLGTLPEKAVIQLNDTHPALAVAELVRLLVDEHDLGWAQAWDLTRRTFAYTNHTLMPEALETWSVDMIERLLPRHLQIIYEINGWFLKQIEQKFPGDLDRLRRMSLIAEEGERRVRMAYLAIVGSSKINGVSELHTRLLKESLFRDFHELWPERFVNITNGVTPRRWLNQANPALSNLISGYIGTDWRTDLERLSGLEMLAEDPSFRQAFREVKLANKQWLGQVIFWRTGISVYRDSLFDVQVKRIHEYKRQLLCLLHAVALYNRLCRGGGSEPVPRTVIFGGKAAPGYEMAKRIIKLINDVARVINDEPALRGRLRLVFIPNYDVSTAATVIPAADLSEQISTAGTEASGTGNMKLSLNGALTIGTLDGANIEIRDAVGAENFFLFGLTAAGAEGLRRRGYDPRARLDSNPELAEVLEQIASGHFSPEEPDRHRPVIDRLLFEDPFLVLADYADYVRCQGEVEALFRDPEEWDRRAILNLARMGRFSSDRTVREYARDIWGI